MKFESSSATPSRAARALLALGVLLQAGCSLFGVHNVEEAAYRVLDDQGDFQLRRYEPMVIAVTSVEADFDAAGSIAFRRLFDYISGANTTGSEIAMTTPVVTRAEDGQQIAMTAPVVAEKTGRAWSVWFVLPAEFTRATAPEPSDASVHIETVPERTVAVRTYSGSWNQSDYRAQLAQLRAWLQQNRLEAASDPRVARYDPPWTLPFLRRNEILIDVET